MERVLVCILASTRAHQLTWQSFTRQVLDELKADLALAVTIDDKYDYANPYWQHAKYRWTGFQPADMGDSFDLAQKWFCQDHGISPPDWRLMLRIKGLWQGGIVTAEPQPSYTANLFFCRWLLLHGLQHDGVLERYDRFVVTRSDFVWLAPHPPLSILNRESLWVPDGEHYGGLTDRHLVVSRDDAVPALSLIDDILLRPDELYGEMKHEAYWNTERFLAHHFERKGLLPRVKQFPYVMYLARGVRETPSTWSVGRYEPSVGHVVKYGPEFRRATAYAAVIRTRDDWESGAWRTFDAEAAPRQPQASGLKRHVLWLGRRVFWALWLPGRPARFGRFIRRTLQRPQGSAGLAAK